MNIVAGLLSDEKQFLIVQGSTDTIHLSFMYKEHDIVVKPINNEITSILIDEVRNKFHNESNYEMNQFDTYNITKDGITFVSDKVKHLCFYIEFDIDRPYFTKLVNVPIIKDKECNIFIFNHIDMKCMQNNRYIPQSKEYDTSEYKVDPVICDIEQILDLVNNINNRDISPIYLSVVKREVCLQDMNVYFTVL